MEVDIIEVHDSSDEYGVSSDEEIMAVHDSPDEASDTDATVLEEEDIDSMILEDIDSMILEGVDINDTDIMPVDDLFGDLDDFDGVLSDFYGVSKDGQLDEIFRRPALYDGHEIDSGSAVGDDKADQVDDSGPAVGDDKAGQVDDSGSAVGDDKAGQVDDSGPAVGDDKAGQVDDSGFAAGDDKAGQVDDSGPAVGDDKAGQVDGYDPAVGEYFIMDNTLAIFDGDIDMFEVVKELVEVKTRVVQDTDVEMRKSLQEGAGQGVFARRWLQEGVILPYFGTIKIVEDVEGIDDTYFMEVKYMTKSDKPRRIKALVADGNPAQPCIGELLPHIKASVFVNECTSSPPNCIFVDNYTLLKPDIEAVIGIEDVAILVAVLVTVKPIEEGEELYTVYGSTHNSGGAYQQWRGSPGEKEELMTRACSLVEYARDDIKIAFADPSRFKTFKTV